MRMKSKDEKMIIFLTTTIKSKYPYFHLCKLPIYVDVASARCIQCKA